MVFNGGRSFLKSEFDFQNSHSSVYKQRQIRKGYNWSVKPATTNWQT